MGISCGRSIIILIVLVRTCNYNIIQCLRTQLGIACSLYFCALGNANLGFHLGAGNFAEVIKHAVVIIIIVRSCQNDIAATVFSSLERIFCQTRFNFTNVDNILKINNTSTNRRTRCRCACSYITDIAITYIFAHANLGSTQINSVNGINLA